MSNKPCAWCVQTTEQIDGLESALEISEKLRCEGYEKFDRMTSLASNYRHKNENLEVLLERANQRIAELESPWISVEDRLPISCRMVWVSGGCAQYSKADEAWFTFMDRTYNGDLARIQWEVTHWRELPEPRKEPSQ